LQEEDAIERQQEEEEDELELQEEGAA